MTLQCDSQGSDDRRGSLNAHRLEPTPLAATSQANEQHPPSICAFYASRLVRGGPRYNMNGTHALQHVALLRSISGSLSQSACPNCPVSSPTALAFLRAVLPSPSLTHCADLSRLAHRGHHPHNHNYISLQSHLGIESKQRPDPLVYSCPTPYIMWLLDTTDYKLHSFPSVETAPEYAALSHRWHPTGEVTFADIQDLVRARCMTGWSKVENACRTARAKGYAWIWIDTCCIDKSSSADLSEAINSMFALYLNCSICLAYLNDVPAGDHPYLPQSAFRSSQWFSRGWTLQELLAPSHTVLFFSQGWSVLGTRHELALAIQEITGIDRGVLSALPEVSLSDNPLPTIHLSMHSADVVAIFKQSDSEILAGSCVSRLRAHSVAKRMSWAARRTTTRPEDRAYSLMGIFDINMPVIYGEGGDRAFRRLQLEIIRQSDDQTIFTWGVPVHFSLLGESIRDTLLQDAAYCLSPRLLAESPSAFLHSMNHQPIALDSLARAVSLPYIPGSHYYETHRGIRIRLPLRRHFKFAGRPSLVPTQFFYGALACRDSTEGKYLTLFLKQSSAAGGDLYECVNAGVLVCECDHFCHTWNRALQQRY
ncbi:HET-domain-containing protein [Trametes sanguinea]|nr:HET-domain-containing protein [Trametes sanguinea]